MKDWIDEGSCPIYPLWYGHGAQSPLSAPAIQSLENVLLRLPVGDQECEECAGLWALGRGKEEG